jgi:HEPN domain-containing protein
MRQEAEMNADLLYRMASGFHKVGVDAAWQLRGTGADAFRMIGPAAVNLALAVELYLKAIYLLNARRPPGVHELWKLFSTLPNSTVELLDKNYSQAFAITDNELKSMHMVIAKGNEEEKKDFPPTPNTVELLLKCHNHAFISWRYLHEFSSKGTAYHFDYHAMHVFCGILNSHIISLLNARPPHFSMTNNNTGETV